MLDIVRRTKIYFFVIMISGKNISLATILFSAFLAVLWMAVLPLSGQDQASVEPAAKKTSGLLFLPVIYYTPETKWALGAGGMYYFQLSKDKSVTRPSNIAFIGYYTQLKQYSIELNPDFYLGKGYHIQSKLSLAKFPDKYYGIGKGTPAEAEEGYTSKYVKWSVEALKQVYQALNIGFQYFFDDVKMTEVEDDGELATRTIPGSEGGKVSGLGYFMTWDSRNSIFFPVSGSYHQFSATFFGRLLGSDFAWSRYYFDLRKYFPLASAHTLGIQARMLFQTGNVPFWRMALFGGQEIMRGYYQGRYRDKNMICLQAEYRWVPLTWRIGVVGFVGLGNVADKFANFTSGDLKYSYGFGLRYLFSREQKVTIRLDFGFGKGTSGIYFTASEAF